MQTINLTSHFLIAMPAMSDPNFSRTLTFICEHNEHGALGIVVNRPIDVNLAALFRQVEIPLGGSPIGEQPVFFGGPVQFDHGFVLHRPVGTWKSTLPVGELGVLQGNVHLLEERLQGHVDGPVHHDPQRAALVVLADESEGAGKIRVRHRRHGDEEVAGEVDRLHLPPVAYFNPSQDLAQIVP